MFSCMMGQWYDTCISLQVETFGSMEKREKVEFILEQMRLCLAKKDYIRTQIISKKINTKFFEDKDFDELKLKYYELMIFMILIPGVMFAIILWYMKKNPKIPESKPGAVKI